MRHCTCSSIVPTCRYRIEALHVSCTLLAVAFPLSSTTRTCFEVGRGSRFPWSTRFVPRDVDRRGESRSPVGPREARGIRPPSRGLLPPSLGLLREGGTDPLRSSPYRRSVRGHVRIVLPTSEKGGHSFPSFPPERGALPSLSSVRIQERGAFLVFVPPKRGALAVRMALLGTRDASHVLSCTNDVVDGLFSIICARL